MEAGRERGAGLLRRLGIDRADARAWALYDWANSAVYTSIVGVVFPLYYSEVVAAGLDEKARTSGFTLTTTIAVALVALTAPVLGAVADLRACKKRFLGLFLALGSLACAGLFLVGPGDVAAALVLFGLVNLGAAGSLVFYDSLLPHVAREGEIDRLSGTGFGLGYLGGGLLLTLQVLVLRSPESFGLPGEGSTLAFRLALLSVAVWWALFSIPLFLRVPEPALVRRATSRRPAVLEGAGRLLETFRELRLFRQAFLMLLAFLVYNDGIATVIRMAVIYAGIKGFGEEVPLFTFLLVQFVGFPAAILFGRLAERFGPKTMIVLGLSVYVGVCFFALAMTRPVHFYVMGLAVGMVQGGCQALGRSLFARLVPRHRSGEFFALLAVGEKFAGIAGPLVFHVAIQSLESPEPAILSLIPFFVVGALLVLRVDVDEGRRVARRAEEEYARPLAQPSEESGTEGGASSGGPSRGDGPGGSSRSTR